MSARQSAVIIGSGIGGLAVANILAKAGYQVTVYERAEMPGGRMGKLEVDGFTYDTGPSWYLMKEVFEQYFQLFDKTTSEYYELVRLSPAYKVFFETRGPITISGESEANFTQFEAIEPGAGAALRKYVADGEKNYKSAFDYFLYSTFTQPYRLLRWDVVKALPSLLPVILSSLHTYVARRFKTAELQQILEYPSVFLGASPFNTPALYQLMSYLDFKEGVFYPKEGGMYTIAESLYTLGKELGVTYVFSAEVEKIATNRGVVSGINVNGQKISADIVIANSDLHYTETQLLETTDQSYPESYWQKRQAGPSALLLYLGVEGPLPELEHHNLFFVRDWQKNFEDIYDNSIWPETASMYVSRTTATNPETAPEGYENLFVLVPLPPNVSQSGEVVDRFVEHYLEQLELLSGVPSLRSRISIKEIRTPDYFAEQFFAWQNTALGMSHTLTQSAFFRPSVKSKKVKNLYYVGGGTQPGIGVPMCIISAQLVYKHITNDGSVQPLTELRSTF